MFEVSGPHPNCPLPYQVIEARGDQAICECWIEGDAQQIADALNQQSAKLARLEAAVVTDEAIDHAAERVLATVQGGAA